MVLLALFWAVPRLFAGGGPFNTLVVVNTNSADSIELGNYYATAHGIPAHHLCSVGIDTNLASLTPTQFRDWVRNPIYEHIADENLEGQIDFVVLCQDFPTRIDDVEGLTAALFYGFQDAPAYNEGGLGCNLPDYTSNTYYRAERAFRSTDGWNNTNGFVAFHLIASNLPTAKLVADRGAEAQSTFPPASINLHIYGSAGRSVREARYANVQFSFAALPGLPATCLLGPYLEYLSGSTNAMGYHDGFGGIPAALRTHNVWLPGAYADHLTSLGGCLPTNVLKQSTVLDWMDIGATASYGTVGEPCAYLEKFPDPIMGFYYARGFSIGEAYTMAVEAPYQGLFAGDPLAAPFAAPPEISVSSHGPWQIVTGTIPVRVSAVAHSNGVPAAALDLYVDGIFATNFAAVAPTPLNQLSVVVGARTNSATVGPGDTLFDAVANLAGAVNDDANQIVSARACGDRLELVYEDFDHAGDHVSVCAGASTGTAATLTLGVGAAATQLVPSIYLARKRLFLFAHTNGVSTNAANAGDTITCTITLTNGAAVTNVIVASAGETITNLLQRLGSAVNAHATLQATNGIRYTYLANGTANVLNDATLVARTPGPDGWGIQLEYIVAPVTTNFGLRTNDNFASFLDDNPDDIRPRASILFHVRPTNDVLDATVSVDTAALPDGVHILDFVARDGSAVAAQSRFTLPLLVGNSSPQLSILGTNGAVVAGGAPPAPANGTDFGPAEPATALTNTFSIRNNGTAPLTIGGWTTNGAGAAAFQVADVPAVVSAGGVSNFLVVFAPADLGTCAASLAFDSDAVLPQTNLLFSGTGSSLLELTVQSDHGAAVPPVGIQTNWFGAVVAHSLTVPAPAGGTQLVCIGWSLEGNEPVSGFATNFEMTVTNDAALTWLWRTNYWLDTEAAEHGAVNIGDSWQTGGATTQITATADGYYHFTNWTGSASGASNPLDLLMDAPKTVQANFAATLAANNTPEWWLAQHGWTNDFDAAATNDAEPDGYFTWQEYVADTDPTNSISYPQMAFIETWQTNLPILTWSASSGRLYQIHTCDDIGVGQWASQQLGLGADTWTDTNPPPATNRYYRISPSLP